MTKPNYYQFAETTAARLFHRLPHTFVRYIFRRLGRRRYFDEFNFITDQLLETGVASSASEAEELCTKVHELEGVNFADLGLMMHGSDAAIRRNLERKITVESDFDLDRLATKPHIILGGHFANFQLCAMAIDQLTDLTVVRRFHSEGRDALSRKISRLTGKNFAAVGVADDDVGIQLIRRLRAGQSVAVMIDYFYEDTSLFLPKFFGKHCATPAGIFMLAQKMKMPVVMMNVIRKDDTFVVHVSDVPPIDDEGDDTTKAYLLAERANTMMEAFVKRYPEQWTFWPALARRWAFAERALQVGQADDAA